MSNLYNDIEAAQRQSYSLGLSVGLHVIILFLMLFNFSWQTNEFEKTPPAILMVDLTKVQLSDKTNLPPEVKVKKKEPKKATAPKPQSKPKEKKPATKTPTVKKEPVVKKLEPVKPQAKPTQKDAVKVNESKKVKKT